MADFLEQLETLPATERRVAMATLVAARGGSPRPPGAKLFVGGGGRLLGSVSIGGCVDGRVVEQGDLALRNGDAPRLLTVAVDDVEAVELGLACGAEFDLLVEVVTLEPADATIAAYQAARAHAHAGTTAWVLSPLDGGSGRVVLTEQDLAASPAPPPASHVERERGGAYVSASGGWLVERFAPPDTLVIVGASDVGAALARLGRMLAMRVVVVDHRDRYATRDRFPTADVTLVGIPSVLARPHLHERASLVLVTHDYRHELPLLREALRSPVRYIGMLAGRRRADAVRAVLREDGFDDEALARVHAPIGLDIGGREPGEIALSIAAQLVAVREGKSLARRDARIPPGTPGPTDVRA